MQSPLSPPFRQFLETYLDQLIQVRDEHARQAEFHAALRFDADAKINAARVLLDQRDTPPPLRVETSAAKTPLTLAAAETAPNMTWGGFILEQLEGLKGGLTHQDLIRRMFGTPLQDRFAKSPNAFYARVNRMEKAGRLARVGKVIYLAETLKAINDGLIEEAA